MEINDRISYLISNKTVFSLQIKVTSELLRPGAVYESPTFYSASTGCSWSLQMSIDRDDVKIGLIRKNFEFEVVKVHVRLSIEDSFKISPFYASKSIRFMPSSGTETVLCVKEQEIFNEHRIIKSLRYAPNDTLTLKCEISPYEEIPRNRCVEENVFSEWADSKVELAFAAGIAVFTTFWVVIPIVERIISVSEVLFGDKGVAFTSLIPLSIFLTAVLNLWSLIMPGGDRTYCNPPITPIPYIST